MKNNLYYYQPAVYNIQHSIIIMYPLFYDVQKKTLIQQLFYPKGKIE